MAVSGDEKTLAERSRRIAKYIIKKDSGELARLAKAGYDRERVLMMIAEAPRDFAAPLREMARQNALQLRSIANRLTTITEEVRDFSERPAMRIAFWAWLMEGWKEPGLSDLGIFEERTPDHVAIFPRVERVKWPPDPIAEIDPGVPLVISGMGTLARHFKLEAERHGRFLRAFGRTETGVVALLVRCWFIRTRQPDGLRLMKKGKRVRLSLDCLNELASLLTYAYEAVGSRKVFSADSLRMLFKRHAVRVIVQMMYLDSAPVEAKPESPATPVPLAGYVAPQIGPKKTTYPAT